MIQQTMISTNCDHFPFSMPSFLRHQETFSRSRSRSRDRDMRWGEAEVDGFDGLMAAKRESICLVPFPCFWKEKDTNHQGKGDLFVLFVLFFGEIPNSFFDKIPTIFVEEWEQGPGSWDDVNDKSLESKTSTGLICTKAMCLATRSCWPVVFLNKAGYE